MKIGSRIIGPTEPPYIIAEIGVNHDGSVPRALELVDAAAGAGADAVKLQLFDADLLMGRAAKLAAYQKFAGESDPIEMLQRLELSVEQMAPIVARAHNLGLHAIVTVFSVDLVPAAQRLRWDAYKSASPDIVNKPLLDAMAAAGKPMIVSTGASTIAEVSRAVDWLAGASDRLALMQCVSCYPTEPDDASIEGMFPLMKLFPGPVGYSDHTPDDDTGALACSLRGNSASLLEKHLTFSKKGRGPDHAASLEPEAFRRYVRLAREAHRTQASVYDPFAPPDPRLGVSRKQVLPCEQDVRAVSRQSLTTTRALSAGHRLSRADLTIKRPGTGLEPFHLEETIGRRLARPVEADMPITPLDLA